ncbi:MAG: acyl carrier protein, partial [Syntrophomonas sp.]
KIIVEIKDIPEEEIQLSSNFAEDLEADSLDIVEMLMLLEEKYSIHIPEEEAEKLKTVQDLVDYLEQKM